MRMPAVPVTPATQALKRLQNSIVRLSDALLLNNNEILVSSLKGRAAVTAARPFFNGTLHATCVLILYYRFKGGVRILDNDENKLKKRFAELSLRAVEQRRTVSSDFLTLDEQSTLASAQLFSRVYLYGGYPLAERRAALFGEKSEEEKAAECDFVWVKISPVAKKFADELTHRDFLGTLMGLGIKRETIGDILTDDNCGYVFCEKKVARFVLDNLDRVKHTTVRCEMTLSPPNSVGALPEERTVTVPSLRLDAMVAAVYKISRSESQQLFMQKLIFVNGKMTVNSSYIPKEDEIISVRHKGRFVFCGKIGETKKQRLKISVRVF